MAISVEARTEIISLVVGMFGAAPGASVLSELVASVEAGSTNAQLAANLVNTAEFKTIYPTFLANSEFAAKVVANLLVEASDADKAEATAVLTTALNGGMTRATAMVEAITFVGNTAHTNAAFGTSAAAFDNKVAVATYFSVDKVLSGSTLAELQAIVSGVGSTAASVTSAKASIDGTADVGKTFVLTTSLNNFVGTSGNDTFDGGVAESFSAFDNIDGGAGIDTLNVLTAGTALPGGVTVKNVENVNISTSGNGYTADTSAFTGLTALTLNASTLTTGAVNINSASAVNVSANVIAGAAASTINIGATTAATGAVVVSETASITGGQAAGAITVKGGTTVSVTQNVTNATALAVGANTTATQGAVTVTGTAATTAVTVKQTAAVTQATTVAGSTESNVVTWKAFTGAGTQSIGGMTITATGAFTDAQTAQIAGGGTAIPGLTVTTSPTLWTVATAAGATNVFTSTTANKDVTAIAAGSSTGLATDPTSAETAGVDSATGAAGIANGTVSITDANSTSTTAAGTITSVSLENFNTATANSGALTSVTLKGTGVSFTQTSGALTTATATTEALILNGVTTTGAVNLGAVPTTVNVQSLVATNKLASLSASGATAVNISGDKALTLTAQTLNAAAVITSTNTAGVTLSTALTPGVTFTGGAGKDVIELGASTKASTMGAGDDTVKLTGAALGVAGTVAGGDGRDTLSLTEVNAVAVTLSTSVTNFSGKVTGFEILEVAATTTGGDIKVASLNSSSWNAIDTVTFAGAVGHAMTVSGLVSGNTVGFKATSTAATTVDITGALAATTDVLNVSISSTAGRDITTLNAANIETINFLTDDSATTATGIQHSATLVAASVKTISVAGDAGLALTNTNTTVTSFDASGVTKGAVSWTTGLLAAAATIKGGAGDNTINFSAATKAVTYTGGAAIDTVTANGKDNIINTGGGADVITLGAGANTVDAGAGNDTINLGAGLNIVTGGAGTDKFSLVGVAITNGNSYSTIQDFTVGETIAFADGGLYAGSATLGAKLALAGTAAFADFLQAATAGTTPGEVKWFQYSGDTYVVNDASATAAYVNGTDQIIKLAGALDLSASTVSADGLLTFVTA